MKREKPKRVKAEMKQIHFDMEIGIFLEFEKRVYSQGLTISEYFRNKALEELKSE